MQIQNTGLRNGIAEDVLIRYIVNNIYDSQCEKTHTKQFKTTNCKKKKIKIKLYTAK